MRELLRKAPVTYKVYKIPKRTTGQRTIYHPSKSTKLLQYALLTILQKQLVAHECSFAYRHKLKSPLRKNAEQHSRQAYLLRIDAKDFFPSITPNDLFLRLEQCSDPMELDEDDKAILKNALFIKSMTGLSGLPIGAPSSPAISNAVMYELDTKLSQIMSGLEVVYTRYADDFVFSSNTKGIADKIFNTVRSVFSSSVYPRLIINEAKTRRSSRNSKRVVTGMVISPDGSVGIGQKNKRMVRSFLFKFLNRKLNQESTSKLQGWLAYILDAEPSYYNTLCHRYGAEHVKQALKFKLETRR